MILFPIEFIPITMLILCLPTIHFLSTTTTPILTNSIGNPQLSFLILVVLLLMFYRKPVPTIYPYSLLPFYLLS